MLTRTLSSASVCLRCRLRLRLSNQKPRSFSALSIAPSPTRLTHVPRLKYTRHYSSELTAPVSNPETPQEDKEEGEAQDHSQDLDHSHARDRDQGQYHRRHQDYFQDDVLFSEGDHAAAENGLAKSPKGDWPPAWNNRRTRPFDLTRRGGKKHRAGNRLLTEGTERLDVEMLGRPAHAIVMKEGVYIKKELETVALEEEDAPPTDIKAILDSQTQPATPEEASANIDELRPTTETTLPEEEFRKLQKLLTGGFLKIQLKDYIEHYKKQGEPKISAETTPPIEEEAAGEKEYAAPYEWIDSISPWVPLNVGDSIVEGADRGLRGYLPGSATEKEKLAVWILRKCWRLSIQELSSGIGEMQIMIRDFDFTLLMRGTQSSMRRLGRTWLDPGEKIEAFKDQKMLRLVTTKSKAEVLLKDLHETLSRVTTKTIPFSLFPSKEIDDALLEEVGRISNTHIRRNETGTRLHITWIESRSYDSRGLEDLGHIVFRLLWTALAPERASAALYAETSTDRTDGRFVVDKTSKEKWGWKDKMREWARYVLPLPSLESEAPGQDANSAVEIIGDELGGPLQKLPLPIIPSLPRPDEIQVSLPQTYSSPLPVRWPKDIETTTKAYFGHVLHPHQPAASLSPSLPDLLATSHHPRIFSPITPHPLLLSRLESGGGNLESSFSPIIQTKSTIVMRFWPSPNPHTGQETQMPKPIRSSPWGDESKALLKHILKRGKAGNDKDNDDGTSPTAPVLELRLAATDMEIHGVESLRAIVEAQVSDVMLPASPADLRFTQTRHVDVQPTDTPEPLALANWSPISDFLSNARLDLAHGKLETPPRQKFPIPRRLFSDYYPFSSSSSSTSEPSKPTSAKKSQSKKALEKAKAQEETDELLLSTSYEFVGLELHRSVSIPYANGHRLTYTSVEAGQGGGRRAEVTLEPGLLDNRHDNSAQSPGEEEKEGGMDGAVDAADELQKDFLACCYRLAKSDSLWSGYILGSQRKA